MGERHEAYSLAERLGMSEARLNRLALAAGVRQVVRLCGRAASRSRTVIITSALHDVLLAWCTAPASRATLRALAEATDRADRHSNG